MTMFHTRMQSLREKLSESAVDVALITDDDTIFYLTGYYDYLHMEFGRPTVLVVPRDGDSLLITPSLDLNAARSSWRVDRSAAWNYGKGQEWRQELPAALRGAQWIGLETDHMPPVVVPLMKTWFLPRT